MNASAPNLLLVADDEVLETFLRDNLEADGYVVRVLDGDFSLDGVGHWPDVAVIDITTDRGRQCLIAIRDLERAGLSNRLATLILGDDSSAHLLRSDDVPDEDLHHKPFSYPELRRRLDSVRERGRRHGDAGPDDATLCERCRKRPPSILKCPRHRVMHPNGYVHLVQEGRLAAICTDCITAVAAEWGMLDPHRPTLADRAARAHRALRGGDSHVGIPYDGYEGLENRTPEFAAATVTALLADLRHFCDAHDIDYGRADHMAHEWYDEQRAGDMAAGPARGA